MNIRIFGVMLSVVAAGCAPRMASLPGQPLANQRDVAMAPVLAAREADWRNGAVIYHVLVDRFAPSENLDAKRSLYPAPKTLHPWTELPKGGRKIDELGVWSHEIAFWGGDLKSLRGKLDYIDSLDVDVLYLNPIHAAYTNHKYDAQDYAEVSPEYGTREDVIELAKACHDRGMKFMLDGVFNHMGRTAPRFKEAMADPKSRYRDWFFIGPQYRNGFRGWANVPSLPEVNLENREVQKHIWDSPNSVVQKYLREGVDGWRLDVAYDIGFSHLFSLTRAAHRARPGSWIVGEIWNYPEQWQSSLDGVMNFHARQIVIELLENKISGRHAGVMLDRMVSDAGLEPLLKCWFMLDNHDTTRLKSQIPDEKLRRIALVLQFTLPGSPVVYYGTELGMDGNGDPANRAPMRWDLVRDDNPELAWMKKLLDIRRSHRALRIGEFRLLDTENALAFSRSTDRASETVFVVANPTSKPVREVFSTRDSKTMSAGYLKCLIDGSEARVFSGTISVEIPPQTIRAYVPVVPDGSKEYSAYKRVQ